MSNSSILAGFVAETLLGQDANVIKEIKALRDDLRYTTKGGEVSLDDTFVRLQAMVDEMPTIVLDKDVPTGTETEYQIRLTTAQERVLDDVDRILRLILEFQSKLKNAERAIKKYKTDFMSWYILAAAYEVEQHNIKFPPSQIKQLAEAEFTRLIDNIDLQVENLLSSVEHLNEEARQHKKTQSEKYGLGKDQANVIWTSNMSNAYGAIAPNRADDMAQVVEEEEEDDEDVPAFVSKRPMIGKVEPPTLNKPEDLQNALDVMKPGDTVILEFHEKNVAPKVTDKVIITVPDTTPEDAANFLNEDEPEPAHAAAIAEVRKILADPTPERNYMYKEPAAAPIKISPRKKLILSEDEDLM